MSDDAKVLAELIADLERDGTRFTNGAPELAEDPPGRAAAISRASELLGPDAAAELDWWIEEIFLRNVTRVDLKSDGPCTWLEGPGRTRRVFWQGTGWAKPDGTASTFRAFCQAHAGAGLSDLMLAYKLATDLPAVDDGERLNHILRHLAEYPERHHEWPMAFRLCLPQRVGSTSTFCATGENGQIERIEVTRGTVTMEEVLPAGWSMLLP